MTEPGAIPNQLPFLAAVCWQVSDVHQLTPRQMLQRYERGWHYRGVLADLEPPEAAFVDRLVAAYGSWLGDMFTLDQHQKILTILSQLKADLLADCQAYFGGGTWLALKYGEYRLSRDIDLLCSDQAGYLRLRRAVFDQRHRALFERTDGLDFPREVQANHYGIRFPVVVDGLSIRLEIVSEGRIALDLPEKPNWCPIAGLCEVDAAAEKLLANSDRWLDAGVLSRDLIDLAILRRQDALPAAAFTKAEAAYPVVEPLRRAIAAFQQDPEHRRRCYQGLQVKAPGQVAEGLDQLAADFDLGQTERIRLERA
ncbi:nucleotidyl transferase AbiEii/AbiGii toxin family protein [Romeria aff. gracilis LEGE 07310]|uniref:Nucleotidyl transferase AbiEii/AbiGii toxin family protein n=1 Tax=Vasconcelosia minhoensis LEGE 07310 TaxID=915328 RepID=A0A8J7AGU6_9CYAN|nr:nucleotidyl transferase AbiEii/AbiGii toxin family protein [Romeria gracilis]MBE9078896.1 nucleotidyl transferase AbiEii/AbiGii toxin family protein [Romeria aff. gracilis LEGE 07310]